MLLLAAAPAGAQQAGGGVPVTTDAVRQGAVPIEILANGIVASESVVTVRTRVDGQITQVHVTEGQMVKRGQPLFTLDSRLNQAVLAQQEAQLMRDRAQAARTEADARRYQSLRGESFASQQRFEQAQADALAAAATVRATEAMIAQTKLQVEFATITAEIDGRLGALPLRVGNFVRQAESTAITTLTQVDPILVQFAVPERWLAEVKAAMARGTARVRVQPEQDGAPPPEGELVFVDSAVDTGTGTILLKARFANAEMRLWPGQYVQVTLTPRAEDGAITVATAAVQTGQQGRYVFVLAPDNTARRRTVTLERTLGDRAVVRGELKPGEKVIVDGAQRVTEGSRAVERNPEPAAQRVSQAG
ncbi:efflux RND transporter periplasmic adaptor subunit [Siccirubricoccus phaeus]|uniref:efflux RND transporter periplasmic adaptor subunit n=1 Tax=Siccirubricoccus phaeus TaxID=2595053 RepID=UPI001F255A4A|nr:efflux RND transporter periplasmic adaptor subunit [Siccirubricoccus phaeus]